MAAEDELLNQAIAHANRAAELLREGYVDAAFGHDSLADTFCSIAHEVRVGTLKRKYAGVSENAQLSYTMTNELRGGEKAAPEPPATANVWFGGPQYGTSTSNESSGSVTLNEGETPESSDN